MNIEGNNVTSQYQFRERLKVKRKILNLEKGWDQRLGLKYKRTSENISQRSSKCLYNRALTTRKVLCSARTCPVDDCGFHTLLNQHYFISVSSIQKASNPRLMLLPVDTISSSKKILSKLYLSKRKYLWFCSVNVTKIERLDESR